MLTKQTIMSKSYSFITQNVKIAFKLSPVPPSPPVLLIHSNHVIIKWAIPLVGGYALEFQMSFSKIYGYKHWAKFYWYPAVISQTIEYVFSILHSFAPKILLIIIQKTMG